MPLAVGSIASSRRRGGTVRATWANPPPITVDDALNRATQVTPTGTFTDNGYAHGAPAASTNYDLRGAECVGYVDWDTQYHTGTHQHQTTLWNGVEVCGSQHGQSVKLFRLAQGTAANAISIVGGKGSGDQPTTFTWGILKHGRTVQDDWDAGGTSVANPTNDGGSLLTAPKNGSYVYVDGYRAKNIMDGITFRGDNGTSATYGFGYIKNCYVVCRDTAISNENGHLVRAFDVLFENCYGLIDQRNGPAGQTDLQNIFEYCLIRLQMRPGGHQKTRSQSSHGQFYKENNDNSSPQLVMDRCTLACNDPADAELPGDGSYTLVTLCWLGAGAYPATIRPGVTVLNSAGNDLATAQDRWDSDRNDWLVRHGFPSGEADPYAYAVDMDTMVHALGPPVR